MNFRSIFEYNICFFRFYAHAVYFMNSYNEFDNFDIIYKFIKRVRRYGIVVRIWSADSYTIICYEKRDYLFDRNNKSGRRMRIALILYRRIRRITITI